MGRIGLTGFELPPDDPLPTLEQFRANLPPELELRELWDILQRIADELNDDDPLKKLPERVESILLERLENWGP